jgi:uncharacterized cupredoxin-like copper-binding protein
MRGGLRVVTVLSVIPLFLACGGGDEPGDSAQPSPHSHGGHSHDVGSPVQSYAFTLGKPAQLEQASRTVNIQTKSGFRFAPDRVAVTAGETVAFEVTNKDKVDHELILGNKAYQQLHESQLQAGGVFHDYSEYSVHVAPGATLSFAYQFEEAGEIQFACHLAGHYARGMVGRIQIS